MSPRVLSVIAVLVAVSACSESPGPQDRFEQALTAKSDTSEEGDRRPPEAVPEGFHSSAQAARARHYWLEENLPKSDVAGGAEAPEADSAAAP